MSTPHNNANKGDFAKTVLMPGDPLRAKFIAETFLTEPKLVNNVRGVQGYLKCSEDRYVAGFRFQTPGPQSGERVA